MARFPGARTPSPLPIADYAMLGDRHTAALVGAHGGVDWLCLPRFDSPACFAALLGDDAAGRWLICPAEEFDSRRRYLDDTLVLETTFTTADGEVTVTDLMPVRDGRADLVRTVRGVRGSVRMHHEWVVRFDYGETRPWVRREGQGRTAAIVAVGGPDQLVLRGPHLPEGREGRHEGGFTVGPGDELVFSSTWLPSYATMPPPIHYGRAIAHTMAEHRKWAEKCPPALPHADVVTRSLITLGMMTHEQTGGIVAAPTTSLPEDFGGQRNWDYRYCWLRDAALTITSLLGAGYTDEARLWRDWLMRAVAGDPEDLQIMYAVDGGRDLVERTLDHLPGYADSRPVRVGNAAVDQYQADVLGEVMIALDQARARGLSVDANAWALQRALVNDLADHWDRPDSGLWEIRGPARMFTHSRVMVWAAFDRAVAAVEEDGVPGEVDEWRRLSDQVREEVLTRGWNQERQTFTQHYDTTEVDASLLLIPMVGFLPFDDPKVLGTIAAVEHDLLHDGLVLRYRTQSKVDGLSGHEHPFLACSFWLASCYASVGRGGEATAFFDRLCGLTNDVGLLSEEYDPAGGRMVGNFPQAFSHLALVQTSLHLAGIATQLPTAGAGRGTTTQ